MTLRQLFTVKSSILPLLTGSVWFMPVTQDAKWLLFSVLLALTAQLLLTRCEPGQACAALTMVVAPGAAVAWANPSAIFEFRVLLLIASALALGAVATLFIRTRKMVSQTVGSAASPTLTRRAPLPPTSEVLAKAQKESKRHFPVPKYIEPTWQNDFRSIVGMDEFKKQIRDAAFKCVGPEDKNGIMLHGEPGDGKTMFAQALAGELGVEFIAIKSQMSKWVGEETANLFKQLEEAVTRPPCVIFFDEADSVLGTRSSHEGAHVKEQIAIVNRLLTFLVDYRSRGVVFVAATNFIDAIDPAVRRPGRFDYIFEVPSPDMKARAGLLAASIKKYAATLAVAPSVVESLARRWNGFNSATLLAVPSHIPQYLKDTGKTELLFDDFMAMLRRQQGAANRVPEQTKSFAQMSYPDAQAQSIKNLISRMHQIFEIEESGGSAPTGVLFHGESGTGKTETARMIAKETKWAFFPVAGPDLARDPSQIDKLMKKVRNSRPAIILIDEADDLLGERSSNPYKASTNKLLDVMDGAAGRMIDVLWIASTNFGEISDPAVMRPGRFTEKIKFHKPGDTSLLAFAKSFFNDPRRNAVMDASWEDVAEALEGCSIADASGILMQAWNITLTANGGVDKTVPVTKKALLDARAMILV
jgi:transitional endoplasmic reticulum ATPase